MYSPVKVVSPTEAAPTLFTPGSSFNILINGDNFSPDAAANEIWLDCNGVNLAAKAVSTTKTQIVASVEGGQVRRRREIEEKMKKRRDGSHLVVCVWVWVCVYVCVYSA